MHCLHCTACSFLELTTAYTAHVVCAYLRMAKRHAKNELLPAASFVYMFMHVNFEPPTLNSAVPHTAAAHATTYYAESMYPNHQIVGA
jgi:hypothetical protein